MIERHLAGGRQEFVLWILSIHTTFDGVTLVLDHILCPAHLLAASDADLLLHDVDAGTLLRDRMLHLDTRVHLEEVEVEVVIDEELHRASVTVTYCFT